MHNLSFLHSIS